MKEYGDEEVIFLLQQEEQKRSMKEHENKIEDGYIILYEETVPFKEMSISDYGFSMLVPEAFEEMSEDMIIAKYPNVRHPHYVLSSPNTTMNLAFRQEEDDLPPEETEAARDAIRKAVMRVQKAEEVDGCKTVLAEETSIACFDFISPARDADIYNLMFLFSFKGKLMLGTFNCLQPLLYEWKEIALQKIQSIKTLEHGGEVS